MAHLKQLMVEKFILKTMAFVSKNFPDWPVCSDDIQLRKFIVKMIDFGNSYRIYKEKNVQKLIHYYIQFTFDIPLNKRLDKHLSGYSSHEDNRMESFYLSLVSKSYRLIPITLDTNV